jgi:hypothetical protein
VHRYATVLLQHWGEIVTHYKNARAATELAAQRALSLNMTRAQIAKRKAERELMIRDRREMLRDGRITREEAKLFIDRHREEVSAAVVRY